MRVTVQVDEPRRDDLAGDVRLLPAGRQAGADRRHPVACDGHVAHRVQTRFRVDDPPAPKHHVIGSHGWAITRRPQPTAGDRPVRSSRRPGPAGAHTPAYAGGVLPLALPLPAWLARLRPEEPALPESTRPLPVLDRAQGRAYALAAFREETRRVAEARVGTRNDTLNRAAFSLGQLVAAGLIPPLPVMTGLAGAAARAGLPADEARRTIRSGMAAEARGSRVPPRSRERNAPRLARRHQPIDASGRTTLSPSRVTNLAGSGIVGATSTRLTPRAAYSSMADRNGLTSPSGSTRPMIVLAMLS